MYHTSSKRRRLFNVDTWDKDTEYETVDRGYSPHELATVETSVEQVIELPEVSDEMDVIPDEILHDVGNNVEFTIMEPLLLEFSFIVLFLHFISVYVNLFRTVLILTAQVKRLKWEKSQCFQKVRKLQRELSMCTCKQSVHATVLKTDEDVVFHTGLNGKGMFSSLHGYIAPFVKRRWKGVSRVVSKVRRAIIRCQRGPCRKLESRDEFLLTLMRLKLCLLHNDLAKRFKVSKTLSGQIFNCWLRAMARALPLIFYIPNQGVISATTPKRFNEIRSLHSIIECSELFIETPQDHELQAITWSTYKHHNTLKFLIAVAPNSSILYISIAYTGRISDKEITVHTGYLDMVPPYTVVMCDKDFQIEQECAARRITHYIPPGKRGMSQMGNVEVAKTKANSQTENFGRAGYSKAENIQNFEY